MLNPLGSELLTLRQRELESSLARARASREVRRSPGRRVLRDAIMAVGRLRTRDRGREAEPAVARFSEPDGSSVALSAGRRAPCSSC
jgi:hypothetical protein